MQDVLASRERYRPDGKMKWERLPVLVVVPLASALGIGWLLNFLFERGWYYVFFVPMLSAAMLGCLTMFCVQWSHCRKPWLAGVLGVSVGLVGYLSYYHFGLLQILPPGNIHRVDLLPSFIQFRMAFEQEVDDDRPVEKKDIPGQAQQKEPKVGLNWFRFTFDLGCFVLWCAVLSWNRAKHPYSTGMGGWMTQEVFLLHPNSPQMLLEAFEKSDLEEFVAAAQPPKSGELKPAACKIEYVNSQDVSPLKCPVYLSVTAPNSLQTGVSSFFGRRSGFTRIRLEPRETLALKSLFPKLAAVLDLAHKELRELPKKSKPSFSEMPTSIFDATESAQIVPVPEPYGGRVFNTRFVIISNLLGGVTLVAIFGGIGLGLLGVYLAEEGWGLFTTVPLLLISAVLIVTGVVLSLGYSHLLECLYSRFKMRQAIRQRPDSFVDADDPDAVSIGLTVRENWVSIKWETASDIGLLKIDPKLNEVRIEADHERFCIPVGSLLVCSPECLRHPVDPSKEFWMVRLVVHLLDCEREILFSPSHIGWRLQNNSVRRKNVNDLCRRIRELDHTTA